MAVSLKTQSQSRGQYSLHAKCRYCGNAWFPFGEKTFDPPVDAMVKCTKCKLKQHIHWIGAVATISPSSAPPVFPSLKPIAFEQKKAVKPEIPDTSPPVAPLIRRNAPEIEPLPELKEKPEPKQEARPIFKSHMLQTGGSKQEVRPVFKASTRLQGKPFAKSEPPVQSRPEIKPAAPAPVREIKIEDEPAPSPVREVKIDEPEPRESRRFEDHAFERHEVEVEPEPRAEPERKQEEVFRAPKPEPEPLPKIEIRPEPEAKSEIEHEVKEPVTEKPQEKPEPRSMFKPQSSFRPETGGGMGSVFKSKLRRDLKQESRPPVKIPEAMAESAPERELSPEVELEPKRPERHPSRPRSRRESLFPQKKSEVEVRESPLEDEPELEKVPEKKVVEAEPKPAFSSGWPSRKKPKRKLSEDPSDVEDSSEV